MTPASPKFGAGRIAALFVLGLAQPAMGAWFSNEPDRPTIMRSLSYGTMLEDVSKKMGYSTERETGRDFERSFSGMRWRYFRVDPSDNKDKFFILCFKKNILVGMSQSECESVKQDFDNWQNVLDELAYQEDLERSRGVPLAMDRRPNSDARSAGFTFVGRIAMEKEPFAFVNECNVDRSDLERSAEQYGTPCAVVLLQSSLVKYFNLPVFGHKGSVYAEVEGGSVRTIFIISRKYDQKDFFRTVRAEALRKFGAPAFSDEMQVSDDRGRFIAKEIDYWKVSGAVVYLTNYGNLSSKAMMVITLPR